MKKVGKRQRPKLTAEQELWRTSDILDQDGSIEHARFEGGQVGSSSGERLMFDDVRFRDVSFAGSDLAGVEFVDVVFCEVLAGSDQFFRNQLERG